MKPNNTVSFSNSYHSIFKVTLPLILVYLSNYIMMSIDRIILSTISTDMMNAVAITGTFISSFTYFFVEIIEKSGVFVSQYYGDKQFNKVSACVWQMIILALSSIPIALILSHFATKLNILPSYLIHYGIQYQKILLPFSFISFIYTALSTFFIGQRKTYIISLSVLIGCAFNLISTVFFVKVLDLNIIGSAYGTILGYLSQLIFLLSFFFNEKNREIFKTTHISLDFKLIIKIFRLGLPMGILSSGALVIWFIISKFVSDISSDQLTLYNLIVIINLFFSYVSNAMLQGISTMSANLIPKGDLNGIKKLLKKFMKVNIVMLITFFSVCLIFKKQIVEMIFNLDPGMREQKQMVMFCFYAVIMYGSMEFIYKLMTGICLSGGDTKFVSIVNAIITIGFDFLPILAIKHLGYLTSITPIILIFLLEPIPYLIIFIVRYKSLKWYKKLV